MEKFEQYALNLIDSGDEEEAEAKEEEEAVEQEKQGEEAEEEEEEDYDELNLDLALVEENTLDSIDQNYDHQHQQFDRIDYEALASRKRKELSDTGACSGSVKTARLDSITGASREEILQAINHGTRRRKSRKPKKRGRRKGSKKQLSPEITKMLGYATVASAHGRYEEAMSALKEVIRVAPHVPESYHTLGIIYELLGNTEKAMGFKTVAAGIMPKECSLWRELFEWHNERGDVARALNCLSKAITADPNDVALRKCQALLYVKIGNLQKAAESFEQISQICPEDVEALKRAAELYSECGQTERTVSILEGYLKNHPSGYIFIVIDILAAVLMETNAFNCALQRIEHAHQVFYSGHELPLQLKIKAGICHLHLENIEKAEILFSDLKLERACNHAKLITDVADAFMNLGHVQLALKYYHMLEPDAGVEDEGYILEKIAECYLMLNDRVKATAFFYKALHALEDNVDCRLSLASLIFEDGKGEEAISLLAPPKELDISNLNYASQNPWWLNKKIKLKLCHIYRSRGMLKDFVNILFPLVRESLSVRSPRQKVKKRLTTSVLRKRTQIVDGAETNDVIDRVRPLASRLDRLKASRARKLLQKKEEQKAADRAAGFDCRSDDSDVESMEEETRVPSITNFLTDEEHHNLIIDLCKSLQSLERYWEALEIIDLTRRMAYKKLPVAKKEELQSLAAQISYKTTDPKHGFEWVRSTVIEHPYSLAAWNCYYKLTLRLGKNYSKHAKFLRYMRSKHDFSVAPIVIYAHQLSMGSHHQDAAREYLTAYKLLSESHLINLCVGTSLLNLALGFRLQNKHHCLTQGLSFLYKNLQLAESSQVSLQEALYNIARAYHHVGLASLAALYYEKVLEIREKDYSIPKLLIETSDLENLKPVYCDLRREAAHNLHLIYKSSGAFDLARQVLKDHCKL
ncbi:uncharacterized protein LOC126673340 [Mercurialis annua]|uniref:uncharacterized protein LOC126673340 n=1 Tax=Mercurialis annua TaxID=3986 RepID=UPI00215E3EBE|nr:uncharacterized protein LOC126673340 [Mercurialis annua]